MSRQRRPGNSPAIGHPPRARRGSHTRTRPWRLSRRSRILALLAAIPVLVGGVALAGPNDNPIEYRITAPVTVQALGVNNDRPTIGEEVRAGAKLVAERAQGFDYAVLVVRDQAGRNYDFPATKGWTIGTSQKEYTASRSFDRAGTYSYWFGYAKGGDWINLAPTQTFTVVDRGGVGPGPSPTGGPPTSAPPTAGPTQGPPTGPPPKGRACPAWPAVPDASCTGVPPGIALRACPNQLNSPAVIYDGCLFTGTVTVNASHITIKNSKVVGGRVNAGYGSQTGLVLTDVEIDGQGKDQHGQSGIGDHNYTCIRCNVHHTGRGAAVGSNVVIRDSWFHDFHYVDGAHQSAVGSNGGSHNTIVHNNLVCNSKGCSGSLVMYGDFGPINDVLVQNNLFNTNGSYCTYAGSATGKPHPVGTNIRYLDNRFGKDYHPRCGIYGPVSSWSRSTGNVWTGNAWSDGSGLVNG